MGIVAILTYLVLAAAAVFILSRSRKPDQPISQFLSMAALAAMAVSVLGTLATGLYTNESNVKDIGAVFPYAAGGLLVLAGLLFIAGYIASLGEGAKADTTMRLNGYPVPPRKKAPWVVATTVGIISFVMMMATMFVAIYALVIIQSLAPYAFSGTASEPLQPWFVGGLTAVIVLIILSYWLQRLDIFLAEREYSQLSDGIEKRLAEQRRQIALEQED